MFFRRVKPHIHSFDERIENDQRFSEAVGGCVPVVVETKGQNVRVKRRRQLQRELLAAALRLVRPGGVVAYVTCSPHPAETIDIVAGQPLVDAREAFPGVDSLGAGPAVQLWPHRQGTDAMFCALIERL